MLLPVSVTNQVGKIIDLGFQPLDPASEVVDLRARILTLRVRPNSGHLRDPVIQAGNLGAERHVFFLPGQDELLLRVPLFLKDLFVFRRLFPRAAKPRSKGILHLLDESRRGLDALFVGPPS